MCLTSCPISITPCSLFVFVSCRVREDTKLSRNTQVYIKKPLNAFMLFLKEKRPTVTPAIKRRGNRAVTSHLGSVVSVLYLRTSSNCICRHLALILDIFYIVVDIFGKQWKSLSSKEQEKYYKEAKHQRFLHQQQHLEWSANENYVSPRRSHISKNKEAVKITKTNNVWVCVCFIGQNGPKGRKAKTARN